jgi:hypothetical protein
LAEWAGGHRRILRSPPANGGALVDETSRSSRANGFARMPPRALPGQPDRDVRSGFCDSSGLDSTMGCQRRRGARGRRRTSPKAGAR